MRDYPESVAALKASDRKREVLASIYRHVYPGRIDKLLSGGIDLVPDRREGYRIWDLDGRELLDLHLNGGTFNLGHRNPDLIRILNEATGHWDIGNHHFPSEPKAMLADALLASAPGPMQYVVFTPSGSEANDVAIKSARYATGRRRIVAIDAGYHGRTGLSGAAGDDSDLKLFLSDRPREFIRVPFNDLAAMGKVLRRRDVALVMMETIPATYGFPLPDDDYLPRVKALCERYGTLYLADEVQTGLGRTGLPWAIQHWKVEPDLLVTGKGLSGGLYPMSAVMMTAPVGDWLKTHGWGHVSTFGGSDLGCVVARAALEMSIAPDTLANAREQGAYLRAGLEALRQRFPFLEEIRQRGLVIGLRFTDSSMGLGMMRALYENGIWAIIAGFDESVLQFKPGLLVSQTYCDEVLARFEDACIWLVANFGALIGGAPPEADDPVIVAAAGAAREALAQWQMEGAALQLLKHRENTVFRVDSGEQHYALRLHRRGYHEDAELNSEQTWITALNEAGIRAPRAIPTTDGSIIAHAGGQQCTLIEWVDGIPFDDLGRVERGMVPELTERYRKLGRLAARLHEQARHWNPPQGFVRQVWDQDGLLGQEPLWGRFWEHPVVTPPQRRALEKARIVLGGLLDQLGTGPDVYGLIHADFLPENILVDKQGQMNLIDFDDCGYGWHLFEMAGALFPHVTQNFMDDLAAAYRDGYRELRPFSEAHFELLPAFILLRGFTYLGWLQTRAGSIPNGDRLAQEVARALSDAVPELLGHLSPPQRIGVEAYTALLPVINAFQGLRPRRKS